MVRRAFRPVIKAVRGVTGVIVWSLSKESNPVHHRTKGGIIQINVSKAWSDCAVSDRIPFVGNDGATPVSNRAQYFLIPMIPKGIV